MYTIMKLHILFKTAGIFVTIMALYIFIVRLGLSHRPESNALLMDIIMIGCIHSEAWLRRMSTSGHFHSEAWM